MNYQFTYFDVKYYIRDNFLLIQTKTFTRGRCKGNPEALGN